MILADDVAPPSPQEVAHQGAVALPSLALALLLGGGHALLPGVA